jgi:hypothetical protein
LTLAPKSIVVLDIIVPLKFTDAPKVQVAPIQTISQADAPSANIILISAAIVNAAGVLKTYIPAPLSVIGPDMVIAQVIQ